MVLSFRATLRLALLVAAATLALPRAGAVSIVPTDTWIPDELVLINFNNSGLDWVYAGPFRPGVVGGPQMQGPEYRAIEGWRHATDEEWSQRPAWTDFILPGYTEEEVLNEVTHDNYRYASEYWSLFDTVDVSDAAEGMFYRESGGHSALFPSLLDAGETWFVRTSRAAPVPEEAAVGGLLAFSFVAYLTGRRLRR